MSGSGHPLPGALARVLPWPLAGLLRHSAVRFLIVGVFNTGVGISVIFACKYFLGVADVPANATGYAVGVVVSFLLNRRFTFVHRGSPWIAFARFLVTVGFAYLVNLATVLAAIEWFGINHYVAHLLGVAPYTASTYLLSRYFVFTEPDRPGQG